MKHKTLLLFQLFLLVFALYALLEYSSNQRLIVSLACLVGMLVLAKFETSVRERSKQGKQGDESEKKDETKAIADALDCLLKSKNVLLLTDAIHYLMQDIGLSVSPTPDYPAIDRIVRIPGTDMTLGLKIIGDVSELNESWDQWDELADFDLGKTGKRRLLIISSNSMKDSEASQQKYRNYPPDAQRLLAARQVVGITTLTLYKIYLLCKKKKLDLQTIFYPIQNSPGGVFKVEHIVQPSAP